MAALTTEKRRGWRAVAVERREAEDLEDSGRYAAALRIRERYLKWCREVFGDEHPFTASGSSDAAFDLNALGKLSLIHI